MPPAAPLPPLPEQRQPVDAVLFDFHGTIAQVEDPIEAIIAAAHTCGTVLDPMRVTALADRWVTAGRPGGPRPAKISPSLAEVYADRDLSEQAHRAAYVGLADLIESGLPGFSEALYDRVRAPAGWRAYAETGAVMRTLVEAGVKVAVVSNIGFDIRPIAAALGFADQVSAWALSYEFGRCKPDPAIFHHACELLAVEPVSALMVGNDVADAGAVAAGCRTLLLPTAGPGAFNSLDDVLTLAL